VGDTAVEAARDGRGRCAMRIRTLRRSHLAPDFLLQLVHVPPVARRLLPQRRARVRVGVGGVARLQRDDLPRGRSGSIQEEEWERSA
jgi:hypothetical protein